VGRCMAGNRLARGLRSRLRCRLSPRPSRRDGGSPTDPSPSVAAGSTDDQGLGLRPPRVKGARSCSALGRARTLCKLLYALHFQGTAQRGACRKTGVPTYSPTLNQR
jgi:hypothetical protein